MAPTAVAVAAALVDGVDALLTQQAETYTRQKADADTKLAGQIKVFLASAEHMKTALSDRIATLQAELAACRSTTGAGASSGYDDLQLSRSGPEPPPALDHEALSQEDIDLGMIPNGVPMGPSIAMTEPYTMPHDRTAQTARPGRPKEVYQGPYHGVPVTLEERETINRNKLDAEAGRGGAGLETPPPDAALEQYTLNTGETVRVGYSGFHTWGCSVFAPSRSLPPTLIAAIGSVGSIAWFI